MALRASSVIGDVRLGSLADIEKAIGDVRFTPQERTCLASVKYQKRTA